MSLREGQLDETKDVSKILKEVQGLYKTIEENEGKWGRIVKNIEEQNNELKVTVEQEREQRQKDRKKMEKNNEELKEAVTKEKLERENDNKEKEKQIKKLTLDVEKEKDRMNEERRKIEDSNKELYKTIEENEGKWGKIVKNIEQQNNELKVAVDNEKEQRQLDLKNMERNNKELKEAVTKEKLEREKDKKEKEEQIRKLTSDIEKEKEKMNEERRKIEEKNKELYKAMEEDNRKRKEERRRLEEQNKELQTKMEQEYEKKVKELQEQEITRQAQRAVEDEKRKQEKQKPKKIPKKEKLHTGKTALEQGKRSATKSQMSAKSQQAEKQLEDLDSKAVQAASEAVPTFAGAVATSAAAVLPPAEAVLPSASAVPASPKVSAPDLTDSSTKAEEIPRQTRTKPRKLNNSTRAYLERLPGLVGYGFVEDKLRVVLSKQILERQKDIKDDVEARLASLNVYIVEGHEIKAQHATGSQITVESASTDRDEKRTTKDDKEKKDEESNGPTASVTCTLKCVVPPKQEEHIYTSTIAHFIPVVQETLPNIYGGEVTYCFECKGGKAQCVLGCTDTKRQMITSHPSACVCCVRKPGQVWQCDSSDICLVPQTAHEQIVADYVATGVLMPVPVLVADGVREEVAYIVFPKAETVIKGKIAVVDHTFVITIERNEPNGRTSAYMFDGMLELEDVSHAGSPGESGSGVFVIRSDTPHLLAMYCARSTGQEARSVRTGTCKMYALPYARSLDQLVVGRYQAYIPAYIFQAILDARDM